MWFIIVGVGLVLTNLAGVGPAANWNWEITGDLWKMVLPFILGAIWWWWSDISGLNKRREMNKMEEKKRDRRKENLVSLGMDARARRKR